jgi:hypothetical protein
MNQLLIVSLMINLFRFIILLSFLFIFSGCRTQKTQLHQLSDLRENQQLLLRNKTLSKSTYGLLILGKGEIDGRARIALLLDGRVYKTEIISGKVQFQWREKWRNPHAIIRYQPLNVTEGNLRFSVTFLD